MAVARGRAARPKKHALFFLLIEGAGAFLLFRPGAKEKQPAETPYDRPMDPFNRLF